jgi:hypothetical protein
MATPGIHMAEKTKLVHPWLVAVWPGMGHVALNAGYYMLAKLDMAVLESRRGSSNRLAGRAIVFSSGLTRTRNTIS